MAIEFTIAAIGVIILLGFIGQALFAYTSVPSAFWLLLFGVVLGASNAVHTSFIHSAAPLISALAIIGILSDGGMRLNIRSVASEGIVGFLLMVAGFLVSTMVAAALLLVLGFSQSIAIITGIILGGTSSAVVIPIVTSLRRVSDRFRTILSMESVMDTFSFILAIVAIESLADEQFAVAQMGDVVGASLLSSLMAAAIGVLFGLAWYPVARRFERYQYSYASLLGAFILVYALHEISGVSGAVAVFFGGIALANAHYIYRTVAAQFLDLRQKINKFTPLSENYSRTHSLVAFLIRVFFFVFLGLVVGIPQPRFLAIGFAITLAILLARLLYLGGLNRAGVLRFSEREQKLAIALMPRGLSQAVLAIFVFSKGVPGGETIAQIVFAVILFSIVAAAAGVYLRHPTATDEELREPPLRELPLEEAMD